jgi:hypothetical protein
VLLRRNIVIDAETAQLVAAAVQAAPHSPRSFSSSSTFPPWTATPLTDTGNACAAGYTGAGVRVSTWLTAPSTKLGVAS